MTSAEVAEAPATVGPKAMIAKMFAESDKDNDGKVTEAEASAAATVKFTAADANKDGYLERDELTAMRKAHWDGMRGPGRAGKAGPGERGLKRFQLADKDGDGKISKSEAPERMAAHFDKIDTDGDGYVTQDEAHAMMRPRGMAGKGGRGPMAKIDADGDGKVSAAEFVDGHVEMLKKADVDGDGAVTMEEISSAAKQMRGHFGRRGMGPGGKGHGRGGHHGMRGERGGERFAQLDADKDGKVTKAEAEAAQAARFAEIDTNKNGVLETAELTAHHQTKRTKHMAERFASLDTDGNGTLSLSEVPPFMADRFETVDANGDGAVTAEEMKAAHEALKMGPKGDRGPRVLRMDADNDGKVTAAEFEQKHAGWFERADANKDGAVTLEELRAGKPGRGMKR